MGKIDSNYQIVYRGEFLTCYVPGGWVFFQRPKHCGGGYWLDRVYDFSFLFELPMPVSLSDGIRHLQHLTGEITIKPDSPADFYLE